MSGCLGFNLIMLLPPLAKECLLRRRHRAGVIRRCLGLRGSRCAVVSKAHWFRGARIDNPDVPTSEWTVAPDWARGAAQVEPYPAKFVLATWGVDKALQEIKTWAQTQLVAFSHFTCSVDLSWISGLNTQHISAHLESAEFWSNQISRNTIVSCQAVKLSWVSWRYTNTPWELEHEQSMTLISRTNSQTAVLNAQPHPVCAHALLEGNRFELASAIAMSPAQPIPTVQAGKWPVWILHEISELGVCQIPDLKSSYGKIKPVQIPEWRLLKMDVRPPKPGTLRVAMWKENTVDTPQDWS